MDSVLETVDRLRHDGFLADLSATEDGHLECNLCGTRNEPLKVRVEEVVRFEGASNPSDQLIAYALHAGCGHAGVYTSAYGPYTPRHDSAALQRLRRPRSIDDCGRARGPTRPCPRDQPAE